jgi:hypothetical protein
VLVMSVIAPSAVLSCVRVEIWPLPVPKVSVLATSAPTWTVRVPLSGVSVALKLSVLAAVP